MAGENDLLDLSEVLSEFARTMVTDFAIQAILDRLVERIVDVLPIDAAGVTLISAGADPHYIAASDQSALRFEQLQTELSEGPCMVAYQTGLAVSIPDLFTDTRFERFAPRAIAEGLVAVFTFPLRHGTGQLGALDLYRNSAGPLDSATMVAAQTLADVAAAYLLNAKTRAELIALSEQSLNDSLHDPLTGLPNRVLFLESLNQAVKRSSRSGKMVAVIFADLDKFKEVNDAHGHGVGDELLVAVARRIGDVLRPDGTLARMSGDEFVILCEGLDATAQVESIAARISLAFEMPFALSGTVIAVTASVGIAFSARGDHPSSQILHQADSAMYQAKRNGGARHQIRDLRGEAASDTEQAWPTAWGEIRRARPS